MNHVPLCLRCGIGQEFVLFLDRIHKLFHQQAEEPREQAVKSEDHQQEKEDDDENDTRLRHHLAESRPRDLLEFGNDLLDTFAHALKQVGLLCRCGCFSRSFHSASQFSFETEERMTVNAARNYLLSL